LQPGAGATPSKRKSGARSHGTRWCRAPDATRACGTRGRADSVRPNSQCSTWKLPAARRKHPPNAGQWSSLERR